MIKLETKPTVKDVAKYFKPVLSKYCPSTPFAKQLGFMMLPHNEAFFGGALGGGKSECVLMDAMQYLHLPGYAALVLRRTKTDLQQPGALLHRMKEWMQPWLATKEVRYDGTQTTFYFPTYNPDGSRAPDSQIVFGFIGLNSNAYNRYQGGEFQYVCFDELCQHREFDYNYLLTRLRKCCCPVHGKDENKNPIYVKDCTQCKWAEALPIKMRGTGNPDGIGMAWVRRKFKIQANMTEDEAEEKGEIVRWLGYNAECPFVPSSYKDNPYLDSQDYEDRMRKQLKPDMYEAYMNGSWGVIANSRFKRKWQKHYSMAGIHIYMGPNRNGEIMDSNRDIIECFMTVDPAVTSDEGPGDTDLHPTKVDNPSWTVISTWWLLSNYQLLWADMIRIREDIPTVLDTLTKAYELWRPTKIIVEKNGVGVGLAQFAENAGMPIEGLHKSKDKVENATEAILRMKQGRIWTPWPRPHWMTEMENEVFTWQGHPKETDDIVDTLSMACNYVPWKNAGKSHIKYDNLQVHDGHNAPSAFFPRMYETSHDQREVTD